MSEKKTAISVMLVLAILSFAFGESLRLTEADNKRTNSITFGTEIIITLKGNPTTGYEWGVASFSTNKLQQVGGAQYRDAEQSQSGKEPRVGVGGRFVFKFKAIESGRADLKLVYRRSWETTAYDKVYSVVLDIR